MAAYVTVPPAPPDADVLAEHWRTLVAAGADELTPVPRWAGLRPAAGHGAEGDR
jgi:hypothetical protein